MHTRKSHTTKHVEPLDGSCREKEMINSSIEPVYRVAVALFLVRRNYFTEDVGTKGLDILDIPGNRYL